MTGPRQLKPGPYRAYAIAWQYDGSHVIQWRDTSKGGEHWRRLDEQCNGRFPEPDAKLIAAAPELLAALIAVRNDAPLLHGGIGAMVDAAIAKATGGAA